MHQLYLAQLPGKTYYGLTGHTLEARRDKMMLKPVSVLKGHPSLSALQLQPLGRRVDLETGLALEAAYTAMAWVSNQDEVRGGPWCMKKLLGKDVAELTKVAEALKGKKTNAEMVEAINDAAGQLPRRGSLRRHLHNECFKCKGPFGSCRCQGLCRQDVGFNPPPRNRSGKSQCGNWKRKQLQLTAAEYYKLKWGAHVATNRAKDNAKQNARNPHRRSGIRKRPAASGVRR